MSSLVSEIIPFSFLFVLLILYLATKKATKFENKSEKEITSYDESKVFLESAEAKLIALRDLYRQDLIDSEIYLKKTDDIANSITRKIGKEITEIAFEKKNDIYNQLKVDIVKKVSKKKDNDKSNDLDLLISAVDKRIEVGFDNEKN
tara:strand:+ start:435 stop:875 length:441 start_codon:yes stop_codon:yes gene_type:complete